MSKNETNYVKEADFVVVDPPDMSDAEVRSNDEKNCNTEGKAM